MRNLGAHSGAFETLVAFFITTGFTGDLVVTGFVADLREVVITTSTLFFLALAGSGAGSALALALALSCCAMYLKLW